MMILKRSMPLLYLLILASILASALPLATVHASNRTAPLNSIETQRKNRCADPSKSNTVFGAVWVNDINATDMTNARWNEAVTVPSDATTIDATMWTTAFVCSDHPGTVSGAQIINLASASAGTIPISFPYGNTISRGNASPGFWTDRVPSTPQEDIGVLRVRLDVSGVAANGELNCSHTFSYSGRYRDNSGTGETYTYTNPICIRKLAPLEPNLTPTTSIESSTIPVWQKSISVNSTVTSSGTTNEFATSTGVTRFVIKNSNTASITSTPGTSTTSTDSGYTCRIVNAAIVNPTSSQCDMEREKTYDPGTITDDLDAGSGEWNLDDLKLELGDKICFVTVVNRYLKGQAATSWRYSAPACTVVAKSPSAQVAGGDLIVRGHPSEVSSKHIHGASYVASGDTAGSSLRYGSWAEYGIFGPNTVTMHSAGALAWNTDASPPKNNLTFANSGSGSPGGFDTTAGSIMSLSFSGIGININNAGSTYAGPVNNPVFANKENIFSDSITLTGGTIASDTYIIKSSGTVHITGDIRYIVETHTRIADIPQVIIIAENITIDSNVTNIDAWLIATNAINTCGENLSPAPYYAGLNSDTCSQKLRINGITRANHILLRRTSGAEGDTMSERRQPAEVFNGRSDAYLWQYGRSNAYGTIRTQSVRELPPRF